MHDDDVRNPRRIGSRVSFSAGKTEVKQCVVLKRRRDFVIWLVALVMAFKDVRNLILINHNDGFIDDDEFVVLYDLFASKNIDFPYDSYAPFDLEELDESESFAEFRFGKRDVRILKEVLQIPDTITCSQRSVCDGLEGLCMLLKRLSYQPVARGCTCVFEHLDMVKISKNGPKHVSHGPLLHLTALHLLIFLFRNDY